MTNINDANTSSISTNSEWTWAKIAAVPPNGVDTARRSRTAWKLPRRNWRKPLTVTAMYSGGPQCCWILQFRGERHRFEGWMCLHDVLAHLNDERWHHAR